uniref:NADH-ubiquinone oxidoreductase chain 2 n=1 Tax=Rhinoestrus usbekistanicus TaxID=204923 RepID=A0A6C0PSX2_9MUSC|nr:NADH dehydrogenase subunit 2 [Rhinoestrus usbekistanicus]QHX99782.1 NADH dehydrogenase subunit 2 [Rhinoestrus usbekistanicus]
MFNNSSKIMFMLILMVGTLISISANSWLSAWMGLEINLLSFIPLMSDSKLMSTEASLKYFLTQALASSILLFAMIMYLLNFNKINSTYLSKMMISSALFLKSGIAPFHFWFPNVMEGLTWINALILMTWQKIAPMMLISYTIMKPLIILSILMSSLIGALGGLNQISLRKLMAYSSINHMSWMLMALLNNNLLWMIYFIFYSFLSMTMIYMFNIFKTSHINQLFSLMIYSKSIKFLSLINLLSLGGLPPFLGFLPKWIIIQSSTNNNQLFILSFLIIMALITLFFYLRLSYSALMLNYFEMKWMTLSFYNHNYLSLFYSLSFLSVSGLFLIIPIYFLS